MQAHGLSPKTLMHGALCLLLTIGLWPKAIFAADGAVAAGAADSEQMKTAGAPSSTRSLNTEHLPPAQPAFAGQINLNASQSKSWWPPQVVPPPGAPNVLLIMTDDVGF